MCILWLILTEILEYPTIFYKDKNKRKSITFLTVLKRTTKIVYLRESSWTSLRTKKECCVTLVLRHSSHHKGLRSPRLIYPGINSNSSYLFGVSLSSIYKYFHPDPLPRLLFHLRNSPYHSSTFLFLYYFSLFMKIITVIYTIYDFIDLYTIECTDGKYTVYQKTYELHVIK